MKANECMRTLARDLRDQVNEIARARGGSMSSQERETFRLAIWAELATTTSTKCGAYCRSTGLPCRAPALQNGRCKLHGGKSTGPKTDEGRKRCAEAQCRRWAAWRAERGETSAPDKPEVTPTHFPRSTHAHPQPSNREVKPTMTDIENGNITVRVEPPQLEPAAAHQSDGFSPELVALDEVLDMLEINPAEPEMNIIAEPVIKAKVAFNEALGRYGVFYSNGALAGYRRTEEEAIAFANQIDQRNLETQ